MSVGLCEEIGFQLSTTNWWSCTELVLKIMDASYCLCVHIFIHILSHLKMMIGDVVEARSRWLGLRYGNSVGRAVFLSKGQACRGVLPNEDLPDQTCRRPGCHWNGTTWHARHDIAGHCGNKIRLTRNRRRDSIPENRYHKPAQK